MTDETEDPTLPATRPTPTPEVFRAPVGAYPVPTAAGGATALPLEPTLADDPYRGGAMLELTPEERAVLTADLPTEWFDVLPSGAPYLPWPYYAKLLNRAFGQGRWCLIPRSPLEKQLIRPERDDGRAGRERYMLSQTWALYCRGQYVREDMGAQEWQPSNPRQSYDDAVTALQSNALMRCMKWWVTQPWEEAWRETFLAEHAVQVFVPNKDGKLEAMWRLKTAKPFEGWTTDAHGNRRWGVIERGPVSKPREAIPPVATATDDPVDSGRGPAQSSGGVGGSGGVREGARVLEPGPRPPAADADEPTDFAAEMRNQELAAALAKDVAASKLEREAVDAQRDENERIYRGKPKADAPVESFIGVISDAQHKALWAEARRTWGDQHADAHLHALIERYGAHSTKQIKRVTLPAIMQAMARIQAEPATPEPPPAKPAARLVPRRVRR